jgi:hypothetical protein
LSTPTFRRSLALLPGCLDMDELAFAPDLPEQALRHCIASHFV